MLSSSPHGVRRGSDSRLPRKGAASLKACGNDAVFKFFSNLFIIFFIPTLVVLAAPSVVSKKILSHDKRFRVIDDFDSGTLKKSYGASWVSSNQTLKLEVKKNELELGNGFALKIEIENSAAGPALVHHELGRLDVSRADALVFRCRAQELGGTKIKFTLWDGSGKAATQDASSICGGKTKQAKWKDGEISLADFSSLDTNLLTRLEIRIEAGKKGGRGELWLDDVAFRGRGDVEFESHRDNIAGFPKMILAPRRQAEIWALGDSENMLLEIARDTWKFFENAADKKTRLVIDHLRVGEDPAAAKYTSPTNIAMDLLATVAAYDLGFIDRPRAASRARRILQTLRKMKRSKGFFYNFYDTSNLEVTRDFVSSVDSGWLAVAMVVLRQAFPNEVGEEATRFLDEFDFEEFLDPGNNQIALGWDGKTGEFTEHHYGLLATEARATSYLAIGKGDIPKDHWWFIYRTPPSAWTWQSQTPKGREVSAGAVNYFQGYYETQGQEFVPSWGGSLFEFLMPTLVMKERKLAARGLGLNNQRATELHRDYALKEKKYPVWGISPASAISGRSWRYDEYGIKTLGAKGYPDEGVITPHVSFLALDSLPGEAIANIRKLLDYEIYGEYGFFDSINVKEMKINPQYLALDQGMSLVAICNYLRQGSIQERFHKDSIGKKGEELLMKESFFNT